MNDGSDTAVPARRYRMTGRIAALRALTWAERKELLAAVLLLPIFWVVLRAIGLPRFRAWLSRPPLSGRPSPSGVEPAKIGVLVNIAGRYAPGPTTCLTRSLLLSWLLRRRGVCGELRIGVRLDHGKLEAHAWIEYEGKPLNDAQDIAARFAPFDEPLSYKLFSQT